MEHFRDSDNQQQCKYSCGLNSVTGWVQVMIKKVQFHHEAKNLSKTKLNTQNPTLGSQSTVRKKMAAVHYSTILCEPNTANKHIKSHIFA